MFRFNAITEFLIYIHNNISPLRNVLRFVAEDPRRAQLSVLSRPVFYLETPLFHLLSLLQKETSYFS